MTISGGASASKSTPGKKRRPWLEYEVASLEKGIKRVIIDYVTNEIKCDN